MKQTSKNLMALLMIIPLLSMSISLDPISEAFGSGAQKICGDKICSSGDPNVERKKMREAIRETSQGIDQEKVTVIEPEVKEISDPGSILKLSRASVPAEIPLHMGYYDGDKVYFIITDASDPKHAEIISKQQGWKVELAPPLSSTPKNALSTAYMFTNGVQGNGIHGFQSEILTSTPAQPEAYSALTAHVHVTWNDGYAAELFTSERDVLAAEHDGKITLTELPVVLNMPQIVWPDGQMKVKEDKTLSDSTKYGEAQVLDINLDEMTVTFVAHRGWGPDGRTIYYIVTDATPVGPTKMMGVSFSPKLASTLISPSAVDLFQFKNGIQGTGPLGFQAGIGAAGLNDENYSPLWRIFMIKWNDPEQSVVLENMNDIDYYRTIGMIDVNLARPMDSDHIVNCPFIDPFQ